jgi:hypothetical protein
MFSLGLCQSFHGASAAQFEDLGPKLNIPGCVGAAWGDYDDDGYPDLFLAASAPDYLAHPDMLLHNNHDLTFTDVSSSAGLLTQQVEDNGVAWADYNNDGLLDVLVGSGTGYPKLYRNDGGHFSEVASTSGLYTAPLRAERSVSWCDYDGDNWLDVFVCDIFTLSSLYHNDGNGTFTDVTASAGMTGLAAPGGAVGAAWGDYDNDGRPDLLISRYQLAPLLYHNNGDGTFTEVSMQAGISAAVDGVSAAWADYDNDGWLDCYISSYQPTRDWLFHNNHDGTFTDVAATAGMANDVSVGIGAAWADYDNDGYLDLYVGNLETNNQPFLYHNNGNGTFTDVAASAGVGGSYSNEAAMWADIDLDGRLDLFQADGSTVSRLLHNVGPAGNWLRVRALTSKSGDAAGSDPPRDAIGAVVSLNLDNDETFPTGAARTLMRVIDGGSGFQGQDEQIAHFGLADATMVAVRVRFPDGSVVMHKDVAANQQITIKDVPAGYVEIFTDVPLDYWSYPQIRAVEDASIVKGYSDGTYKPTDPVTRDQMAVYISRALAGGDASVPAGPSTATFSDVPTDYWAFKYVEYAVTQNVVKGYSDGTYKPTDQVTRDQMSVFIARAIATPSAGADLVNYTPPTTATFPDVPTDFWAYKYVEYIAQPAIAVTKGYPDGDYHPEYICTRDQMAVYVARAFRLQ